MANYNDVIEKNKRYLTQAQIDALVAASKQYNVENAGNRAGALSSARQQFDAGYRGLQNMGLAGATAAQPTSGEVPRLIQQIRTPVDDYNRRLQDVENKRLNALGGQFAQQTQAAWAAQAQREAEARARQETLQQQYQRAQTVARVVNNKDIPSAPKLDPRTLVVESVKEFDAPTDAERAALKYQNDGARRTAEAQQQAAINAAAALLGITAPNNMQQAEQARLDREAATARNVQNTVTQATKPVLNQKTGDQYTYDTYTEAKEMQRAADDIATKATRAARANKTNDTTEQDKRALKEAQANVDYIDSLYKKMAKGKALTDAEIQAMSQERVAVQQRDLAKEKLENPEKYAARLVLSDPSKRGTSAWTKATQLMAPEIADNVLESMGISKPNMTDEQFAADMQAVKDVRRSLDVIDSLRQEQENKKKTGTTGAIDYDQQFIDEELETLKKLGYTEAQARKLVKRVSNERQTRSEYEYYYNALETEIKNDGLKPLKPVNQSETDTTYRLANNLPSMSLVAKTDYEALATAPAGPAEYMTDEQRNTYNALYETDGIKAANKYVEDISPILNLQRAEKDQAYRKEMVNKNAGNAIWQNILSVGTNLVGNVPAMLEKLAITGYNIVANPDVPVYIDQNSGLSQLSNRTNYIREATSEKILANHPGTWGKIANFLYQSGMSMADSAAAMAVAGALGSTHAVDALFFSSAGNEAYRDARERGATQEQAMGFSILSGAAEAIFEHVSVETFADQFIRQNAKARRSTIAKLLIQSGTEASEEVTTEIANKLADAWVMGDKSEYDLKVKELMRQDKTLTKEQAEKKAFMDALKDVGMAGLGGLVSGLGFGLTGAIATKKSETKTGKAVKENGKLDRLTRAAKLMGGDVAQQAAEVESGKQSDTQVGNLLHELQLAQNEALGIDAESNEQITEAQAEEIAKKGEALDVIMEGEQITADDAQKVIDTLGADKLNKMGYDASSADTFANSYNDNLQKQNIAPMSEVNKAEREFAQGKAVEELREESFERVYKNPKQGLAYQYEGKTVTPLPGNLTAVSFAEQERSNFKARTTATTGNVTYAFSGMQAREGMSNEQTLAEMQKALTKEARNKAEVYSKLASALGIKMTIHDVMTGTNGFIDESGNMHVVLSGRQSVLRVAAHELTHWMKGNNSTGYASLRQHLVNEVGADRFDRMLKQKAREYGLDTSTEKGRTVADDEVCAELCERMLANEDALEKFAEKDTEAAKSLKDRLLKILNAIKQALKNVKNRDFGESWSDLIKDQETIESWVAGLQGAIEKAENKVASDELLLSEEDKANAARKQETEALTGKGTYVRGYSAKEVESVFEDNGDMSALRDKIPTVIAKEEAKQEEKASKEQAPAKTEKEETKEQESPAKQLQVKEAKPAAKKRRPRRYVSVTSTEKKSQGTTFEGGRVPRGMSDLAYKIEKASNFARGHISGMMSDYATFGYSSYSGSLDGDAYGYSKVTWRNTNGRSIADRQSAVSSAADLKQGDAFIDDVVRMDWLTSEELGHASSMEESSVVDRDAADVSTDVLSNEQMKAASSVADMLAKGNDVVLQLPVSENFDQLSRATLKAVFEAMPAGKRTGISFATGLTSADILKNGGDVSLIITDKSQQQTGDGKLWIDMTGDAEAGGVRNSLDTDYMRLADKYKAGTATEAETKQLQRAVEKAAKEAGYDLRAYHGTPNGTFNTFRLWQYFTTNKEYAKVYQGQGASSNGYKKTATNRRTYDTFIKMDKPFDTRNAAERKIFMDEFYGKWGNGTPLSERGLPDWTDGDDLIEFFEENGYDYDSIILDEGGTGGYGDTVNDRGISYVIKNPSQIKSADLVTYDGNGNIIPLSDRFRTDRTGDEAWKNEDIRYSIDTDYLRLAEKYKSGTATETETKSLQSVVEQAAEAAMPNSVARGKDGKLIKFFHGTKAEFTKFERSKIGSTGRFEGSGFNFTPYEGRARSYGGRVLEGYLNIQHPLSADKKTFSVAKLAQLIRNIDPTGDNIIANYAQNTNDYGTPSFIRRESMTTARALLEYNESDVDVYSDLSSADPDAESLIQAFSDMGYDGLIHYDSNGNIKTAVAFSSEQFKLADPVTYDDDGNIIPLSERFNTQKEDIRYSIDTDAIRQAFTVIDAESIEDGLEALKGVKHVGMFALKDISRMLDASAGKNKGLRNTLHAIFEKPHSEATGRYARGVERMQERVLDIAVRAGVVSEKDLNNFRRKIGSIRLDSKKSAAIQNIGEGFSNTYTNVKVSGMPGALKLECFDPTTGKHLFTKTYMGFESLRNDFGREVAQGLRVMSLENTENGSMTPFEATTNTRPYTVEDLKDAFPDDWQKLKRAADEFREMYDEYIRDQNNMLATIYPIESEFDTEEKLEGAIEKKHERLAQHKAEVNARITSINEKTEQRIKAHKEATDQRVASIEKRIETLEAEMAKKKRTDTKAYRDLQNRAFNLFADKENAIAEAAEYEAGQRAKAQALIDALKADLKEYEENAKGDLDRLGEAKAEAQNARQRGELDSLSRMHRLEYRKDYFHHFREMASDIQNLKSIFTGNTYISAATYGMDTKEGVAVRAKNGEVYSEKDNGDISPAIVGRSENTRAKSRWAKTYQKRGMGADYTADAVNGMLRYGQISEYKLAFDPLVAYLRDVNNAIRKLDDNTNRDGLIRYIDLWADTIAGKSHKLDRNISDLGMAPRKAMQILNWINSRVIQNTLLFNARSALIQISNITNAKGIVKNNIDWLNGLRSWALAAKGDEAMAGIMAQSNFLASRYMDNLQLTDSKLKSAKAFGGWMLGALDEISAKATWWAAYQQYTRNPNAAKNQYRTYDNAVDYADDVTRRTHAGRGVGELAPAMTSRVINFVAPFQVEVNNTFQLLKDNVKQGNYLGILSTGLSVFLFNALFEGIVGSSPLQFDFIRAVLDIVLGFAQDDPKDDKDDYGILQAWQRLSGEAFGSLPYAGQLASIIGEDTAKKLFGTDNDATRYGNTQIGVNAVINAGKGVKDIATGLVEGRKVNWVDDLDDLLNLTLPFGAKQLTRTIEGVRTVAKGYEGKYDKEGKEQVHFTTDGDILEAIHAALFGKWSLTEASEYFGEKRLLPQLFGEYNGAKSSIGKAVDAQEYKAALQTGIDGKEYFTLKADMSKYTTQPGKRAEMMQQKLTPEQKAKLDALMFAPKDTEMKADGAVVYQKSGDEWKVKADYTNQDLFDLSQAGDKAYTGTLEAMDKTGLPQDQAALAASMWDRAKEADDRKAEFRSMLRDNANLTVEQKEALDLQYCGNKYPADYSDPELYDLSVTNRATYEKAKEAKAKGVPVSTFTGLSEKKAAHEGDGQAAYMRGEIMKTNLTAKQKELLDDLLVSDKGANPDYSSQAWFDLSMISKTQYDKAKAGAKVGVKPEVYLAAYKKYKEVNRKDKDGKYVNTKKEAKALLKAYMDKQPISAPVYDYIWTAVFGYKSR